MYIVPNFSNFKNLPSVVKDISKKFDDMLTLLFTKILKNCDEKKKNPSTVIIPINELK